LREIVALGLDLQNRGPYQWILAGDGQVFDNEGTAEVRKWDGTGDVLVN
jgi:hypothetical protein